MAGISDNIEQFINSLLQECDGIELQRNELAQYFGCAPSQINYVLSTRFTVEHGYMIQSKRGGSGYILIRRIPFSVYRLKEMIVSLDDHITLQKARALIDNLKENEFITQRESEIMVSAVADLPMVSSSTKDYVRAQLLRNMFLAVMNHKGNEECDAQS